MPVQPDPIVGVRLLNASLDEFKDNGQDKIILRGIIEPDHFGLLKVDDYQRQRLHINEHGSLWTALREGSPLPDIELGMRGMTFVDMPETDTIILRDPVYLIDGLQRVTNAMAFLEKNAKDVRLGATVHLGTNRDWELNRFRILNTSQTRVSPNVLLKNEREKNPTVLTIFGLCNADKDFPLYKKVSWGQNMQRGELITAMVVSVTAMHLHRHLGPVVMQRSYNNVARGLNRIGDQIGLSSFRENVRTFYQLIDQTWGINTVQYTKSSCWLRGPFLITLANFLSDHTDFWNDDATVLTIPADLKRKIGMFPVQDPSVIGLAGSSGKASNLLYAMMLEHINSGKRTKRLTNRRKAADDLEKTHMDKIGGGADEAA